MLFTIKYVSVCIDASAIMWQTATTKTLQFFIYDGYLRYVSLNVTWLMNAYIKIFLL